MDAILAECGEMDKQRKKYDSMHTIMENYVKLNNADASGDRSHTGTLILVEGKAAMVFVVNGTKHKRNEYGIFPLFGKIPNVKKNKDTNKQVVLNCIKKILGLQENLVYDTEETLKSLNFDHLMIMTDQDEDGFHIKGLVINFIHEYWPSLLKSPDFLMECITPIIKATHSDGTVYQFYSMSEYKSWDTTEVDRKCWNIEYFKGLASIFEDDTTLFFNNLITHCKYFTWEDTTDWNAIDLAFGNNVEKRKKWIENFEHGTFLDPKRKFTRYKDFFNQELILYFLADLRRSIPSMVDGLKPVQRKILHSALSCKLEKYLPISGFVSSVFVHGRYTHGFRNIIKAIYVMNESHAGSGNISLFILGGQSGTKAEDFRYCSTTLRRSIRLLFPVLDDIILDYRNELGNFAEPEWFFPVIPMVLVNGAVGRTGASTNVPCYNPSDVISNVRRLMNDQEMVPMIPWYKGYPGRIEKNGSGYITTGCILHFTGTRTVKITLPINKPFEFFMETLESLGKESKPCIEKYEVHEDSTNCYCVIELSEDVDLEPQNLVRLFKLDTKIKTSNIHLFNDKGVLTKYDNPQQILQEFYVARLQLYDKRKSMMLSHLKLELFTLSYRETFVRYVHVNGTGNPYNPNRSIPMKDWTKENVLSHLKSQELLRDMEILRKLDKKIVKGGKVGVEHISSFYEALMISLSWNVLNVPPETIDREKETLNNEFNKLSKLSPQELWKADLLSLEEKLDEMMKVNNRPNDKVTVDEKPFGFRFEPVLKEYFRKSASSDHNDEFRGDAGPTRVKRKM